MISMAAHAAVPAPSVPDDDEDRHYCLHCGGPLRRDRRLFRHPVFDDVQREVGIADDDIRPLQTRPWQILSALRRAFGRPLSREYLVGLLVDDASDKAIDVHICHIRKALAGSPFAIETISGLGYRLVWGRDPP